jgi:hypothetical protein
LQTDFLALYRGQTVSDARLVAVTADPELVASFVKGLGGEGTEDELVMDDHKPLRLVTGDDE